MHTDMTELAMNWYPELSSIINTYNLKIKLDQFGVGKCIYYNNEEIGYFYEFSEGISLHFVDTYGIKSDVCDDVSELAVKIEEVINQISSL